MLCKLAAFVQSCRRKCAFLLCVTDKHAAPNCMVHLKRKYEQLRIILNAIERQITQGSGNLMI